MDNICLLYTSAYRMSFMRNTVNSFVISIVLIIAPFPCLSLIHILKMGFYEGVNLSLSYCDDCGHEELNMDVCPVCGSKNLTKIDRMNGYLSYSRVKGDTRLNDAKMAEIAERKSM